MIVNSWLTYALCSAFFAALTALLGKLGVCGINSNLATLLRTGVILFMTLGIVLANGQWQNPARLPRNGVFMLTLSGIATGLSWLCYWRAMQLGQASKVAPVDKLSVMLVIVLAAVFLGEPLTVKSVAGGILITLGVVIIAL